MTHPSRSANQSKTEPFPASASEADAETPADDDPQQPGGSLPSGAGSTGDAPGVPVTSSVPAPGSSEELPVVQGLHTPEVDEPDPRR
jgi:hypothetical protein